MILFFILLFLFVHFYLPRFITEIKNPFVVFFEEKKKRKSFNNVKEFQGKYIKFRSFDKSVLTGYLTYSELETVKATIIFLHGIGSQKESFVDFSKEVAKRGYNAVALDLRAHGESDGDHCTFGVRERKDISKLLDFLRDEENITGAIGIWGQSLGGAIGLQTMGCDKRVKFGVIESTFTDFKTITNDYFKMHLKFNIPLFTNYLVDRVGKIVGFIPKDAAPKEYCKKITQPILLVHGNEDVRINIKYAHQNYKNLPLETQKYFLEIKGAHHLNVWEIGGDAYFKKVFKFIEKSI